MSDDNPTPQPAPKPEPTPAPAPDASPFAKPALDVGEKGQDPPGIERRDDGR